MTCEIPGLEITQDGSVLGGQTNGVDALDAVRDLAAQDVGVVVGPDSLGTLSFTSGSTGIPKGKFSFELFPFATYHATVDRILTFKSFALSKTNRCSWSSLFVDSLLYMDAAGVWLERSRPLYDALRYRSRSHPT